LVDDCEHIQRVYPVFGDSKNLKRGGDELHREHMQVEAEVMKKTIPAVVLIRALFNS